MARRQKEARPKKEASVDRGDRRGDVTQFNLRIKTSEYRQLAEAADANRVSLNSEMAHRLAQSLEQRTLWSLSQLHDSLEMWVMPLLGRLNERPHVEVLIRASKELLECGPLPDSAKAQAAIVEIRQALRSLELSRRQPKPPAYPGSE